jgi:hypothetical protein
MRSMLPIQTFLVLLALLMAVGCSQKAPPRPGDLSNANATQGPVINLDPQIQVTPSPESESPLTLKPTSANLEADGVWNFTVEGRGAKKLFDSLALSAVDGKKTGQQLECSHSSGNYRCSIVIESANGNIRSLLTQSQLQKAEPADRSGETEDNYIHIDANRDGTKPFARVNIGFLYAEKIFTTMSRQKAQSEIPADDQYEAGIKKSGGHISCTEKALKSDHHKEYWCVMYLNTANGSIEPISLPKVN